MINYCTSKSEKENLSPEEQNEIARVIATLKKV